jgi:hypothetical protein
MNQPKALDLTSEWERIVNDTERHNARVRILAAVHKRKQEKRIAKAVNYAIGAVLSVVLGATGLLSSWVAGSVAVLLVCISCFLFGRVWEAYRK